MGKYSKLEGTIPAEPTERDEAIIAGIEERKHKTFAELATEYNQLEVASLELTKKVKAQSVTFAVLEILLRGHLEATDADSISTLGFNWSRGCEPYPVCEDPDAIVKYFNEHEMGDLLALTKTELAGRLKKLVKEEALANELQITTETVEGPNGEPVEKQVVRSNVPGVRVFLKKSLSRTKASTKNRS
jgi:hypothetical protein